MTGEDAEPRAVESIEVTLFRQILMVPFAIEAADGADRLASGRERVSAIADGLGEPWREITAERWRHLPTDVIAEGEALAAAYAELVYFEPAVQRYLFGWAGEQVNEAPIRLWQRQDVRGLEISIGAGGERERWHLRVDRLNLYLFDTGNAMLVVELAFDPALVPDTGDARDRLPRLAAVMRLIECSRRTFPPFFVSPEDKGPLVPGFFPSALAWVAEPELPTVAAPRTPTDFIDHAARRKTPALHRAWRVLLHGLPLDSDPEPPRDGFLLSQLGDDRAFSIVVIGVDDIGAIAEPDWVRLAMCDGPGSGWPYGRAFLQGWHEHQAYDRHFHGSEGGTRYLFSGYSFAMIGTARRPDDDDYCAFRDTFAEHGRRHYFQLCLIAYFQKAALLTLSERLADATLSADTSAQAAHAIERDTLQFTHRYWFESLSAQVQAQEIFELLRMNLRLRPLYDQVRQEVREADAFATSDEQQGIARSADQLNRLAGPVLAASLVAGIFGANVLFDWDLVDRWPLMTLGTTLLLVFAILAWAVGNEQRSFVQSIRQRWTQLRQYPGYALLLLVLAFGAFWLVDNQIGHDPPPESLDCCQ